MSPRTQRTFLDTNIFVYSFDPTAPRKRKTALKLIAEGLASGLTVISYQVVQEFLNVAVRKFNPPLAPAEARLYLEKALWPMCSVLPDESLYSDSLTIAAETGYSFYDALIVASALGAGCARILTEDLQHGRVVRGVRIENPFA